MAIIAVIVRGTGESVNEIRFCTHSCVFKNNQFDVLLTVRASLQQVVVNSSSREEVVGEVGTSIVKFSLEARRDKFTNYVT